MIPLTTTFCDLKLNVNKDYLNRLLTLAAQIFRRISVRDMMRRSELPRLKLETKRDTELLLNVVFIVVRWSLSVIKY